MAITFRDIVSSRLPGRTNTTWGIGAPCVDTPIRRFEIGDRIRHSYTKETGIIVGFDETFERTTTRQGIPFYIVKWDRAKRPQPQFEETLLEPELLRCETAPSGDDGLTLNEVA